MFDFGFESGALLGLQGTGAGYQIDVVPVVARTGKFSLRISGAPAAAAPASGPAAPPPASVVTWWKDVVARLEANKATYQAGGATADEIEWAIQNARVALQCAQMRSNEVSRDRSMADNVKWILDQDPKARIVLWAHNGHVAAGGLGFETMGASLRRMYGAQMLVFGFAFNEGSFQAIPQGGGKLTTFTVPAAPGGSLDSTLAASGVPLFALDIRAAPAWFRESRSTRLIGAVYPENQPYAFLANLRPTEAYDVMLFVDKTTAAVANPPRK
jgi:erythromycin esterase